MFARLPPVSYTHLDVYKRQGTYKSAVEPFISTEMSPANREQVTAYINSIWRQVTEGVSNSRYIPVDSLNAYADRMLIDVYKRQLFALISVILTSCSHACQKVELQEDTVSLLRNPCMGWGVYDLSLIHISCRLPERTGPDSRSLCLHSRRAVATR